MAGTPITTAIFASYPMPPGGCTPEPDDVYQEGDTILPGYDSGSDADNDTMAGNLGGVKLKFNNTIYNSMGVSAADLDSDNSDSDDVDSDYYSTTDSDSESDFDDNASWTSGDIEIGGQYLADFEHDMVGLDARIQALPQELQDGIIEQTGIYKVPTSPILITEDYKPPIGLRINSESRAWFAKAYYSTGIFVMEPQLDASNDTGHELLGKWARGLPRHHFNKLVNLQISADCLASHTETAQRHAVLLRRALDLPAPKVKGGIKKLVLAYDNYRGYGSAKFAVSFVGGRAEVEEMKKKPKYSKKLKRKQ